MINKEAIVLETSKILIRHFRNLLESQSEKPLGFNTRVFSHMLHPEAHFVSIGESINVGKETKNHPEHIVPCAVLITESKRLIKAGNLTDNEIASLLAKHWKVALITKEEAHTLDVELKLKSVMPSGWTFEKGDTLARLKAADILLKDYKNE